MWSNLGGAPFVTVSPRGLKNGSARIPNNGADFGPDNDTTGTTGIQDALNSITMGGFIYLYGEGNAAPYVLSQALHNTGNGQVVWCEPTVYILNAISQATAGDGAAIIYPFVSSTYISGVYFQGNGFSYCSWAGNGATIDGANLGTNYAIYTNTTGPLNGGVNPSTECEFGGFNLINIAGGALLCTTYNGHGATPTDLQANHNIRYYGITATFSASTNATNQGVPCGVNSCNRILLEDLFIDCFNLPANDYSNPFIWSAQGLCHDIVFRRCYFRGNKTTGQVPELQGSAVSGGQPSSSVTSKIRFEDCIFDSGATSGSPLAGSGGGFLDDTNGAVETAAVTDVEFLRCGWVHCGMTFESQITYFGYIRFRDCLSLPGAISGSLSGRGPTTSMAQGITVTTGTFKYPATIPGVDLEDVAITVQGGTVSEIDFNGVNTGVTQGIFRLRPTDQLTVKNTVTPTMNKFGL